MTATNQMIVRSVFTGLYFVADQGFVATDSRDATEYDNTEAVKASFRYQYAGELSFQASVYKFGGASLPTAPTTQAEKDAATEEQNKWVVFPAFSTIGLTEA